MSPSSKPCPFCQKVFKGLGNHLSRCKERQGRDYTPFLSGKTLAKRTNRAAVKETCPHCFRQFRRLDTHLRRNAFCKRVESQPLQAEETPEETNSEELTHSVRSGCHTQIEETTDQLPSTDLAHKRVLRLPRTDEEWEEADAHFAAYLVPHILGASGVDDKNDMLCSGVYEYFATKYGTRAFRCQKKRAHRKSSQLRHFKSVTKQKNEARQQLRKAQKEGLSSDQTRSLAKAFFRLVREHSRVKRAVCNHNKHTTQRKARQECHQNIFRFAKQLLDDEGSACPPQFSKEAAEDFFRAAYSAGPRNFVCPGWLPTPSPPESAFDCSDFSKEEVEKVVHQSKATSAPSPLDQVGYIILKKCPSLQRALLDLYNTCWKESTAPTAWKIAVIKLLPKAAAELDPLNPANFRPIALTSCVGKIFTMILQHRWLQFMLTNKFMDRTIQKAFLPATSGCTEHHCKLAGVLADARRNHKTLAVCWIDLANAYGSVHHSLIKFALTHYHAPPQFQNMVSALYTGLAAQVSTPRWSTTTMPLQIGVYQGDPLSVVIFNTVINTLVDLLSTRMDLGYSISKTKHKVNLLSMLMIHALLRTHQQLLNIFCTWLIAGYSGLE